MDNFRFMLKISDKWCASSDNLLHPILQWFIRDNKEPPNKMWLLSHNQILYGVDGGCIDNSSDNSNVYLKNLFNNRVTDISHLFREGKQVSATAVYWDDVPIWRYIDTFGQNNLHIHREVTKFILSKLTNVDTMCGIGGEFYRYFILSHIKSNIRVTSKVDTNYIGISNSNSILDLAKVNMELYHLPITLHHVDYNKSSLISDLTAQDVKISQCLVNLSTIPVNLINQLKDSKIPTLILVVCNQIMFNKRRVTLEENYRLSDYYICGNNRHDRSGSAVSIYVYRVKGI